MTTETDLLPLPRPSFDYPYAYDGDDMENYALANIAHTTARLQAEVEALRAEVERLKPMTAMTMGVGSGDGNLFVHGDYESIKAAQAIILERGALRAEVERDKALLRQALKALESGAWDTLRGRNAAAAIRERLGEEE